tara:strand:- start:2695 stop:3927 length:1233 start_codon:yes stop_codon:yes gene_type:complete
MKKKYLAFLCSRNNLNEVLGPHETLFKKMDKNFEKFYIINFIYLQLFSAPGALKDFFDPILKVNIKKPNNLIIFTPKTINEFNEFMIDKEIVGINNLSRNFSHLKIHFILKKFNIPQIMISNFGFFNSTLKSTLKDKILKPSSNLFYFFEKFIGQKFTLFLTNINILKKVDIRFTSDQKTLIRINKSFLKRIFYKLNFFYAKKIIIINSKNYDMVTQKTLVKNEDNIVLLDAFLDHPEGSGLLKEVSQENRIKHYEKLKFFLNKISKYYGKKVIICIHPKDNLENKKKIFNEFSVKQFETPENIYKAFLVLFFDSSAIIDAILLKKKIILVTSKYLPKPWIEIGKSFANRGNILNLDLEDNLENKISILSDELDDRIKKYDKYIKEFITSGDEDRGLDFVMKTIKEKYFN